MRFILGAAVATLVSAQAAADVTVYGKANVSLQHADRAGERQLELQSNSSNIGLKGQEQVADDVVLLYRFEYETSIDDGDKNGRTFSQRNIYLGLQTTAGTLLAGMFDTPLKSAAAGVDLFNNLEGDINAVVAGEIRAKNIVEYVTPQSLGPITAKLAYITKEIDGVDGVSASAAYQTDELYLALAMDQDVEDNAGSTDTYRLVGSYTVGAVQLGGLYEKHKRELRSGDGYFASLKWQLSDQWVFKTQYGKSDIKISGRETFSIGGDYVFSNTAKAFTYFSNNKDHLERDDKFLGVGLELKF